MQGVSVILKNSLKKLIFEVGFHLKILVVLISKIGASTNLNIIYVNHTTSQERIVFCMGPV